MFMRSMYIYIVFIVRHRLSYYNLSFCLKSMTLDRVAFVDKYVFPLVVYSL